MSSILIENGAVVTVDDAGSVYNPGYLFLEDDRIAAVGAVRRPYDAPAGRYDHRRVAHGRHARHGQRPHAPVSDVPARPGR